MSRELVDSGISYLKFVPKNWNIYRIKNAFECNKETVNNEWKNQQLLSLTTNGIKEKDIDNPNGKLPESFETYQKVKKDNLVMCLFDLDMSAVFSGISNFNGMISPAYKVLACRNNMNPRYAGYYFNYISYGRKYLHYSKNIRYTLSFYEFSSLPMLFPSTIEQEKIVNYLNNKISKIDQTIKDNKKAIELLKEYKNKIISKIIINGVNNEEKKSVSCKWFNQIPNSWKVSKIKYICNFNPSYVEEFKNKDEVGYIPMTLLKFGYAEKSKIRIVNATSGLTKFIDEDIIMAKVTPCFENGEIAIVNGLENGVGLGSSELFIFNCKDNLIMKEYLFYVLQNETLKQIYLSTMTGTGGLKRVSPNEVKNSFIPVPPQNEQEKIVKHISREINKIENIKKYRQQIIDKLEEYKKSLIYEIVTGKIEV